MRAYCTDARGLQLLSCPPYPPSDPVTLTGYSGVNYFLCTCLTADFWPCSVISEKQVGIWLETGQSQFGPVLWLQKQDSVV